MGDQSDDVTPDLLIWGFEPGSTVMIADGQISAIVNCLCVCAHGGVLYEVAYWREGERKTAWVSGRELKTDASIKRIGFKTTQPQEATTSHALREGGD